MSVGIMMTPGFWRLLINMLRCTDEYCAYDGVHAEIMLSAHEPDSSYYANALKR